VVSNVIHTGDSLLCEAKLDDLGSETAYFLPRRDLAPIRRRLYKRFFRRGKKIIAFK